MPRQIPFTQPVLFTLYNQSVYSLYSRVPQLFLPYGIYIMNWDELHGKYENFNECAVHYLFLTHDSATQL